MSIGKTVGFLKFYAVGAVVALKETEGEGMSAYDFLASQVLAFVIKHANLAQLRAWEAVAGAQLTVLVVAPAVEVALGVDGVPEVQADCDVREHNVAGQAVLQHLEWLSIPLVPVDDLTVVRKSCKVAFAGC